MNDKQNSFPVDKLGLVLCVALLGTLTGCIGYVDRGQPREVYEEPPVVQTTFLIEDDYIYYPSYECYYSASRHQYAYREGNAWVARSAPRGVSVDVVRASPSVRMDFHDSPAQHHATVTKQYPRNWKPDAQKPSQKENRKDEEHEKHEQRDQN